MKRLIGSFSCAIQGIHHSIASSPNMRIHLLAAAAVTGLGFIVGLTRIEWALLSLTVFMVLVAETVNSAIEKPWTWLVRNAIRSHGWQKTWRLGQFY